MARGGCNYQLDFKQGNFFFSGRERKDEKAKKARIRKSSYRHQRPTLHRNEMVLAFISKMVLEDEHRKISKSRDVQFSIHVNSL